MTFSHPVTRVTRQGRAKLRQAHRADRYRTLRIVLQCAAIAAIMVAIIVVWADRTRYATGAEPTPAPVPAAAAAAVLDAPASLGGIAAYAAPSFGSRYLAIPEGPGVRVVVCAQLHRDRCVTRTSTDAGPALFMQRAGRVADLSFVDFAALCRCDPPDVGTIPVSIEYVGRAGVTPPPTDVQP